MKNLESRVAKLENALGGSANLHDLDIMRAKDGESLIEAVTRVANERGLELKDVGNAHVVWRSDHKPLRKEIYRHPTVRTWDEVTKLIGFRTHEQWLDEIERHRHSDG